ncbi:MAG: hypothetical protein Ta2B_08490 [Termitinemataceae bacterium]|nr:MAG: hypothetical protein Ta2B_08490 [Termitinemataceae bacterium]
MGLIMNKKKSLTYEAARRYRKSNKAGKTAILNEFAADTGYNRKYANRILMHERKEKIWYVKGRVVVLKIAHNRHIKRVYKKYYDAPVEKVVLHIWDDFNLMCGKLLRD